MGRCALSRLRSTASARGALMSHLESLIAEHLEWQGFLIRRNTKVGRLAHGGWEMELDVVGFHPQNHELVHYEPSIDALSWEKRETTFVAANV